MKTNNIITAAFAVTAAISGLGIGFAYAADVKVDFDGKTGPVLAGAETMKADLDAKSGPAGLRTPEAAPARNGAASEIKIKAIMKNAGTAKEETLTCRPGLGADKVSGCKKSDSSALGYADMNTLSLRGYFSAETLKFADLLNTTKHSYTNQSGPMTFQCEDTCANYDLVSIGLSPFPPYLESFEMKCVEWTHECNCIAGC